jgi:hypothetical protein
MADAPLDKTAAKPNLMARMAETHPVRSLTLFAAGTALGLAIAAYGLFSVPGTRIVGVPPEDVALVNGRHILRSDFITQIQLETSLPYEQTTKEQRQKVLKEMVDEELLVQRGLEVDLAASDPDVRAYMVAGVQLQVDADVLAQQPSDEDLDKYFKEHMDKYTGEGIMALRDFVVSRGSNETPVAQLVAKAKQAADAFRKGRDSDDIAATFGLADSGKIDRGDLFDFAVKIKLSPGLYAAATKLDARQASDPIEEDGNVHILLMEKRQRSTVHTLEDARDAVLADFKRDEQTRVETANLSYLKSKADIQVTPEYR